MTKQYKKKQPTGREFVNAATKLANVTYDRCMVLPKTWWDGLCKPLVDSANKIESLVVDGNAVYCDKNVLDPISYVHALEQRHDLLTEALREFKNYDRKLARLFSHIDFERSEKERLKKIVLSIIREEQANNPDVAKIDIQVKAYPDMLKYTSKSGSKCLRICLTTSNRDAWMATRNDACKLLPARISADMKRYKEANELIMADLTP